MFSVCTDDESGGAWEIASRIIPAFPELEELHGMMEAGTSIAFMLRHGEKLRQGRRILGTCYCRPSAQGDLRPLFEQLLEDTLGYYPDFLVILDAEWWEEAAPEHREVLVCHELLHAGHAKDKHGSPKTDRETGKPVPEIRAHDIEEFNAIAERYGAWSPDVREFQAALGRWNGIPGDGAAQRVEVF